MAGFGLETLPLALRYVSLLFVWFGFIALSTVAIRLTDSSSTFATTSILAALLALTIGVSVLLIRRPSNSQAVVR